MERASKAEGEQILAAFGAYTEAMKKVGAWLAGDWLRLTSTALILLAADGKTEWGNGADAETREQLGGFHPTEVPDLDGGARLTLASPGCWRASRRRRWPPGP